MKSKIGVWLLALSVCMVLGGCSGRLFPAVSRRTTLRILSGSENQELEPLLEACAKDTGVRIEMEYRGSVDIMRALQEGAE